MVHLMPVEERAQLMAPLAEKLPVRTREKEIQGRQKTPCLCGFPAFNYLEEAGQQKAARQHF